MSASSIAQSPFPRKNARRERRCTTARGVVAFLSQTHVEPDLTLEVFFIDRPLEGFGSLKVTAPPEPE